MLLGQSAVFSSLACAVIAHHADAVSVFPGPDFMNTRNEVPIIFYSAAPWPRAYQQALVIMWATCITSSPKLSVTCAGNQSTRSVRGRRQRRVVLGGGLVLASGLRHSGDHRWASPPRAAFTSFSVRLRRGKVLYLGFCMKSAAARPFDGSMLSVLCEGGVYLHALHSLCTAFESCER